MIFLLLQGRREPHVKLDPRSLFELGLLVGSRKHKPGTFRGPALCTPGLRAPTGGSSQRKHAQGLLLRYPCTGTARSVSAKSPMALQGVMPSAGGTEAWLG